MHKFVTRSGLRWLFLVAALSAYQPVPGRTAIELTGRVTDPHGVPIIGASVVLISHGQMIGGNATDFDGVYRLSISPNVRPPISLRVSSVGYGEEHRSLNLSVDRGRTDIVCYPVPIELAGIRVTPPSAPQTSELSVPRNEISLAASRSLVSTNPIAALRFPQIARIGSSHSSQIRIDGTNPRYCLNGIPISADPEHYGMLAILPASVVSEIRFYPQGADASYGLPSTIDLVTPALFSKHSQGEISVSTIDATGSYAFGNKRFFALGAIRQSIVNNILDFTGVNRNRQTVPPIDFRDLFFSAGLQLSSRWRAILDQYYVRDRLSFDTLSAIGSKMGMGMAEKTREDFVGLRLNGLYNHLLLNATAAIRDGRKEYSAYPDYDSEHYTLWVQLSEQYRNVLAGLDVAVNTGVIEFKVGVQTDRALRRLVNMDQINWSFQPPFANTSMPYIYANDLNELYGQFQSNITGHTDIAYIGATCHIGRLTFENGMRTEYFSELRHPNALLSRHSAKLSMGERGSLELFYGTFAESPITNILEPQQPLVRVNLSNLTWSKTSLIAVTAAYGLLRLSAFDKHMTDLPFLTPDFDRRWLEYRSGNTTYYFRNLNFLTMQSMARAHFTGLSIALESDRMLNSRMTIYLSYAYTRAHVISYDVSIPYELWAPHRFVGQIGYRFTRKFSAGIEFQAHTGYPYSPPRWLDETARDTQNYFLTQLSRENSLRFTTNFTFNLNASYQLGRAVLFMALTNVTNRANQLVAAGKEMVTDSGILPSAGFRLNF